MCDETQNHILDAIFSPTSTKIADVIFVNKFYGRSFWDKFTPKLRKSRQSQIYDKAVYMRA